MRANEEQVAISIHYVGQRNVRHEDVLERVRSLERQIAQVDEELDKIVYALYGLSPEEIRIVEGKK